ncbi:MAG: hypothetical protein EZS28_005908 [Streblomastix strix]|uniref:NrS-1 polymerase-like helicase domain-containing protein n=1 Tax=Streblomastix strix TaxID=222440 RepID=A0A5J4WUJ0_9EUKA|nr:MAG: hypothetical protein EZS28_005908 [Streblomastix strix]
MATEEFSNDKSNQQTNVKCETLEKGPKCKYTRKSKTDEKAKAMIDQMINEQTNEQTNELTIEPTNSKDAGINAIKQIIEEKYDQHISELCNQHGGTDKEKDERSYLIYRLEKNREDNIFEEVLQPLVELYRQEQDSKTIIERVKNAVINKVNYTKIGQYDGKKNQQITGKLIDSSLMDEDNLCVVDIDIHKDKSIKEIDQLGQNIIDSLPQNVGLVKTAHGGLHIYCNRNFYLLPSNCNVKVAVTDSFDIDVFAKMIKYRIENGQETKERVQNRVVTPNTSIRETKSNQRVTLKYEAVNDWENASHLASLREIFDKWNIDIEMSYKDYAQQQHYRIYGVQINDDGAIEQINDELAQACVDGLKNLEIHNYLQPINMKGSLLSIFCGLYGITNESIRTEGMKNIRQFNKQTANADKNYGQASSNGEHKRNPWILTKILRYHNKDYYEQKIKPLLKKNYEVKKQSKIVDMVKQIEKHEIDLKDVFTLTDVSSKALNGQCQNQLELVAEDLFKIIKVVPCQNGWCFVIKEYDCFHNTNTIHYKNKTAIYDQLRSIRLWQDGKKNLTAIDALEQYHSLFEKVGIRFISQNPKIFSVFQGYKYLQLEEVNYTKMEGFLGLVKEIISANDELIQEYLLNWFAFIVQNASKKTETAIILQRIQARYSSKNITDIDDFVGKFNATIENKMLAIADEKNNFGESRMSSMDALKSIITEYSFDINEKYIPKHEVENVMNMILVTNNIFPIKIENNDRRYVVCKCNQVHREYLTQFPNLCNSFDEDFYNNLFTFFMTRDISQFNPRNISMTQAKKDIIRASRSNVDDIIIDHFKQFKDGVIISQVELWKLQDMILKNYQLTISNICSQVWRSTNGQRKRFYKMKEEMVMIYENMLDEDADEKEAEAQTAEQERQEEGNEYI